MNVSNNINQARRAFAAAGISFIGTGSYQKFVEWAREDGWKTCDEAYARLKPVDFAINARAEKTVVPQTMEGLKSGKKPSSCAGENLQPARAT